MTDVTILNEVLGRRSIQLKQATISVAYKKFIVSRGCVACGATKHVHPHHLVERGSQGQNADDYFCIGLCKACHRLYHKLHRIEFEARFNIKLEEIWWDGLVAYILTLENEQDLVTVTVHKPRVTKNTRKNRLPLSKTCNTRDDYSKFQPTT